MATDDPRLSSLIVPNSKQGQVVIVGCPYDFLRKRSPNNNKGGQDNGACCLRRFYGKVGPLVNSEYDVDIRSINVSDQGNVVVEISKQQQEQKFINVATKRFKGEFVNYYKQSPQFIIDRISDNLINLVKNNQLPFVFGGSKQGLMASVSAFHQAFSQDKDKNVYILSGHPFLQPPYDGNKATSYNVSTILAQKYPDTKISIFGCFPKYFPSEYVTASKNLPYQSVPNKQRLSNFTFVTYGQIRSCQVKKEERRLGQRTQGYHKFKQIFNPSTPSIINISLQVLQLFRGCRDISVQGLQFDEFLQIMMFIGQQENVKIISINEFNPSCQDYESSLLILNAFYYFLMGRAQMKLKLNQKHVNLKNQNQEIENNKL